MVENELFDSLKKVNFQKLNFKNTVIGEVKHGALNSTMTQLTMNHVKIANFNTGIFRDFVNPQTNIKVMNSELEGSQEDSLQPIKLYALYFTNVTIKTKSLKQIMNIQAKRVVFENSYLDSFTKGETHPSHLRSIRIFLVLWATE